MPLDPTDYTTWTAFRDHPIFASTKFNINNWSHDPSCYGELDYYGQFMPDHYIHVDPMLPINQQEEVAKCDIHNLAATCAKIENTFGQIKYEMVILDDFTVYVWIQHPQLSIELYPNNFTDENGILKMFVDSPRIEEMEFDCLTVTDVIDSLRQVTRI